MKTFRIDQSKDPGVWREIVEFEDPVNVVLTNEANGRTIVDAVKFERRGIWTIDRGGDRKKLLEPLLERGERFGETTETPVR